MREIGEKSLKSAAPFSCRIVSMRHCVRLGLILVLLISQPGCARKAAAPGSGLPIAAEPVQVLRADLDGIFSDPRLAQAQLGIKVFSLDRAEVLYEKNPQQLFVPASGNKLITAAVALMRLGPGFHFQTRVLANGSIENGVLKGDLIISGSGDPSGSPQFQSGNPFAVFALWASKLKERNIRAISGDILGFAGAFGKPTFGQGWEWDDLPESYAAPASALQFNDDTIAIEISPGPEEGMEAYISTSPLQDYLKIDNHVTTGPENGTPDIRVIRGESDEAFEMRGTVPAKAAPVIREIAVRDPMRYYLSAFRYAMEREGIDTGQCEISPLEGYDPSRLPLLWIHQSPGLPVILRILLKESINIYAETLVRTLGLEVRGTAESDGGREVVKETLGQAGIEPDSYLFADGSGLSRRNLQSADSLVRLLSFMRRNSSFQLFYDALPAAGIDGTLSGRMRGSKGENNVHAKTGSMTGVSSISGYMKTADGEMLAFSMAANNVIAPKGSAESIQDSALIRLAGFSRKH